MYPCSKQKRPSKPRSFLRNSSFLLPIAAALVLGACSSSPKTTAQAVTHSDVLKGIEFWGQRYEKNPKDREAALNFASALRRTGQSDQAVAVLQRASTIHTNDTVVQAAYGKALAAKGNFGHALKVIRAAQRPDLPDWRLVSAEGAILDQTGNHNDARKRYRYALSLSQNEPSILSNLGMSHVLTGELPQAEQHLRRALQQPKADNRVRQNLALAIGLQGRFQEAEGILTKDLPPEQAAANIAYLRTLLTQENTWEQLKKEEKQRQS